MIILGIKNLIKKNAPLSILFFFGLIYALSPGPQSVEDFSPIPNSLKSYEKGDVNQVPNLTAFYSDFNRQQITEFYTQEYRSHFFWGRIIPSISLNYPPRAAYQYVRDLLQRSTFLEEYVYPLHGSIFINGYEPYVEKDIQGLPRNPKGEKIGKDGKFYNSKTTIRFYPNKWYFRLFAYLGIWILSILLFKLIVKIKDERIYEIKV